MDRLRAAGCVFAEDEARLLLSDTGSAAELDAMVERREAGEPLELVLGWAEFCGLRIVVEPGVFIPRRRTEFLVGEAIALARTIPSPVTVLDLCCGSGAAGAALQAALGRIELVASDLDPVAVRCARKNLAAAGGHVCQGDLFDPLPAGLRGRIDLLVANTPYVPTGGVRLLPPEARLHEPLMALDGGADGLDIARRVLADAPSWLAPGGHVLIETSARQAPVLVRAVAGNGLLPRVVDSDKLGATVVIGSRQPAR